MSEINLHNYEAYLLDFMEGNLSAEDAKALQSFLESHPEIDADIFEMDDVTLVPEDCHFDAKLSLQRDENMPELSKQDALLIGLLENTLTSDEKTMTEALIRENADVAKEFELYKKTRLSANAALTYQNKGNLKKQARIFPMHVSRYVAMAAVFAGLLFLVLGSLNKGEFTYNPSDKALADNVIYFDDEATSHPETPEFIHIGESSTENHLAYQHQNTSDVEVQTHANDEEIRAAVVEYVHFQHIPNLKAQKIQAYHPNYKEQLVYQPNEKKLDWKNMNITYVKETQLANQPEKLKFPKSIDELDETIEELDKRYNPIIKLREAKEELFASNVDDLFKRDR